MLLDIFPQARFVHIVRDPYVVYPSTIHLHKALYRIHGLQRPTFEGLAEAVLSTYVDLYRKLDEGRDLVDPSRFYELRYEDLIADPEGSCAGCTSTWGWAASSGYGRVCGGILPTVGTTKRTPTN